ncbi:MAG TPA: hypothetical protein VK507_23885 [Iamia sp.]|nr:hypothetical protein [Iamia sp.]
MGDDDPVAPGPLPFEIMARFADELAAVSTAGQAVIDRTSELMTARRQGVESDLEAWTGGHRDRFDAQLPASQADLANLIDQVQALMASASSAVTRYAYAPLGGGLVV